MPSNEEAAVAREPLKQKFVRVSFRHRFRLPDKSVDVSLPNPALTRDEENPMLPAKLQFAASWNVPSIDGLMMTASPSGPPK